MTCGWKTIIKIKMVINIVYPGLQTVSEFFGPATNTCNRGLDNTSFKLHHKVLIIRGIGFRAELVGHCNTMDLRGSRYLVIRAGHSSLSCISLPLYLGVKIIKKYRKLVIYGALSLISVFARAAYMLRPPSVYTGRGIRPKGSLIRKKIGKKDVRKGRFF